MVNFGKPLGNLGWGLVFSRTIYLLRGVGLKVPTLDLQEEEGGWRLNQLLMTSDSINRDSVMKPP